jgi:hypothetical protein
VYLRRELENALVLGAALERRCNALIPAISEALKASTKWWATTINALPPPRERPGPLPVMSAVVDVRTRLSIVTLD